MPSNPYNCKYCNNTTWSPDLLCLNCYHEKKAEEDAKEKTEHEERIAQKVYVVCPQCKEKNKLRWNDYSYGDLKQTLELRSCPSGGTYDVSFTCEHCNYREEL